MNTEATSKKSSRGRTIIVSKRALEADTSTDEETPAIQAKKSKSSKPGPAPVTQALKHVGSEGILVEDEGHLGTQGPKAKNKHVIESDTNLDIS